MTSESESFARDIDSVTRDHSSAVNSLSTDIDYSWRPAEAAASAEVVPFR